MRKCKECKAPMVDMGCWPKILNKEIIGWRKDGWLYHYCVNNNCNLGKRRELV